MQTDKFNKNIEKRLLGSLKWKNKLLKNAFNLQSSSQDGQIFFLELLKSTNLSKYAKTNTLHGKHITENIFMPYYIQNEKTEHRPKRLLKM